MYSTSILDDAELKAIGCVAVEAAKLESMIFDFIEILCKFDDITRELFLGKLMLAAKIDTLESIVKSRVRSKPKLEKIAALFHRLKNAKQGRVVVIHGVWMVDPDGDPKPGK